VANLKVRIGERGQRRGKQRQDRYLHFLQDTLKDRHDYWIAR
jgi:hypothetical protein